MATFDFKASQLRTAAIIGSGSMGIDKVPSLLIYSSSAAINSVGGRHSNLLTNVGKDVWMFVSGAIGSANVETVVAGHSTGSEGTVLFGGDVVISGSLYAEHMIIEVDNVVNDNNFKIGSDADGQDRKLIFGHSTLSSVIGIDDSQDVFAINTDAAFEATNDLEIDTSGNVTIGNGGLTIGADAD